MSEDAASRQRVIGRYNAVAGPNSTAIVNVFAEGLDALPRPFLREAFAPLLDDRKQLFGGRQAALKQLDDFVRTNDTDYLVVTAPAGFGKTALMANWIARRAERIAYHFFAPLYDLSSLDEGFFLRSIVEQMAPWRQYTDPLPSEERVTALRAIYHKLLEQPFDTTHVLVLDGLDEAPWNLEPYLHRSMPAGLRIIVTVRDVGQDWGQQYGLPNDRCVHLRLGGLPRDDVAAVLRQAGERATLFAEDAALLDEVLRVAAYQDDPSLGADPFYVRFLAEDIAARDITAATIAKQPKGLAPYLDKWLEALKQAKGEAAVRDLFGTLIVTLGPIGKDDLGHINPTSFADDWLLGDRVDEVVGKVRRLVLRDAAGNLTLAHPRLQDYLETKLRPRDLEESRERLLRFCADWQGHNSPYALRYYAQHLARSAQPPSSAADIAAIAQLVRTVTDGVFQEAHQRVLADPVALQRDLDLAVRCAAASPNVPVPLVITAALCTVRSRREKLIPGRVFDLARAGKIKEAEQQLDLFGPQLDTAWYQAMLLAIAWLALPAAPEAARALHERVAPNLHSEEQLRMLHDRVAAAMGGKDPITPPLIVSPQLPALNRYFAEKVLERLSGKGVDSFLRSPNQMRHYGELMTERDYLAAEDGPWLVTFAMLDPTAGDEYLRRYVDIHRMYGYAQYRNRSLWVLLDAVLRHPDQEWVRDWVCEIGRAALEPSVEIQEGLRAALLGLLAASGDDEARMQLDALDQQTRQDAAELAPGRGRSDSWGAHKRRLAALAETYACVPELGQDPNPLIAIALEIPFGFAGYEAPACLTLAESIAIARPGDRDAIGRVLEMALSAAHNVQDETFCARTTSRVNAMSRHWWGRNEPMPATTSAVEGLCRNPATAEFAALHLVGEQYQHRDNQTTLPIDDLRAAQSLRAVAMIYDRPLTDFQRLNPLPNVPPDRALADGALVHVPDPGFIPLLAAHLAALVCADATLPDTLRAEQIRPLVPLAANATALDAVLSRLLLTSRPHGPAVLKTLLDEAMQTMAAIPADVVLGIPA